MRSLLWKKHIDQEIIDLFLEEIFKKVGRSLFDMENVMKNYIWGDCSFFCNKSEIYLEFEEDYCGKCDYNDYVLDNQILEEQLEKKQNKIDFLQEEIDIFKNKMELMEKDCIIFKI